MTQKTDFSKFPFLCKAFFMIFASRAMLIQYFFRKPSKHPNQKSFIFEISDQKLQRQSSSKSCHHLARFLTHLSCHLRRKVNKVKRWSSSRRSKRRGGVSTIIFQSFSWAKGFISNMEPDRRLPNRLNKKRWIMGLRYGFKFLERGRMEIFLAKTFILVQKSISAIAKKRV